MTTFEDLGLSTSLLKAIDDMGYTAPTLIQEKAIPFVFMNRDILASAQTGTGKTASFTLPMMDILDGGYTKPRMPRAIILEPTRELAVQVGDNFKAYGRYMKLSYSLVIGGTSMAVQEKEIERGTDVLIATPGRLLDLISRGKVMLNEAKMLVIDEADRMMDMGFVPDVEKLVSMMPSMRQTIMFSATFSASIKKLAVQFLDNPKEVIVSPPASTSDNITQYTIHLDHKAKYDTLLKLMSNKKDATGIIFCNRKRDVDTLFKQLVKAKFQAGALHGDMDQPKRLEWLSKFRDGTVKLLVCSDVAARGLDIANVEYVFNMEVPLHSEDYVHRIGRTGRAGKLGTSFTFISKNDEKLWKGVLNVIKKDVTEFKFDDGQSTDKPTQSEEIKPSKKPIRHTKSGKSLQSDKSVKAEQSDNPKKQNNSHKSARPNQSSKNEKSDTVVQVNDTVKSNDRVKPKDTPSGKNSVKSECSQNQGRMTKNERPQQKEQPAKSGKPVYKNRFDSQEGISSIDKKQSDLPFGEQETLPAFLK